MDIYTLDILFILLIKLFHLGYWELFRLASVSLWYIPIIVGFLFFLELPYFLAQDASGYLVYILPL